MQNKKTALSRPRIGVDLLGSELAERRLLKALCAHSFTGERAAPSLRLFGTAHAFEGLQQPPHFSLCPVTETIFPDDDPLTAIRTKKDSSLMRGIEQLKHYEIDAFITAGNSGALLAASALQLPLLASIDRPGFLALMPTKEKPVAVIDVGANVGLSADNLYQFAKMGIAYQKSRGIPHPTVGLLNIGEEKKKGTAQHRKAYALLNQLNEPAPIDRPVFIGNIEGRDVFRGAIDVLVTDGFTGNVFLKTAEGIAGFILDEMENMGPLLAIPEVRAMIKSLHNRLHFVEHPGALLCGTSGIVIKCHGASTPDAFIHSIQGASHLIKNFFPEKMRTELEV